MLDVGEAYHNKGLTKYQSTKELLAGREEQENPMKISKTWALMDLDLRWRAASFQLERGFSKARLVGKRAGCSLLIGLGCPI